MINHLTHSSINKSKWDNCINSAFNGTVFASSWYLDIVSEEWEALILNDYESVMPLSVKRIFGSKRLLQPSFAPELGVFTTKKLSNNLISEFIKAIPKEITTIDIKLNVFNKTDGLPHNADFIKTFEADLILPYGKMHSRYLPETIKALNIALQNNISVSKGISLMALFKLSKKTKKGLPAFDKMNTLRKIIPYSINRNNGEMWGAYNTNNELIAVVFFIISHNKAYCLYTVVTKEGKKTFAIHSIIDTFIKAHSGENLILNFGYNNKLLKEIAVGINAYKVSLPVIKNTQLSWLYNIINQS